MIDYVEAADRNTNSHTNINLTCLKTYLIVPQAMKSLANLSANSRKCVGSGRLAPLTILSRRLNGGGFYCACSLTALLADWMSSK